MLHIINRFVIHLVSSTFLTMAVYFALRYWLRKNKKVRLWFERERLLVVSAFVVFSLAPLREPFDLYFEHQTVWKTVFDDLSWFLGPALSVWGLYRFRGDV